MDFVSGEILTVDGFQKGYIGFDKETIVEIGKNVPKKPICKGLIVPSFINAHTHIGDSFIRDKNVKLLKDVEKLVAPPNGLKHKMLKESDKHEIIKGMKKSIDIMIDSGNSFFCDFREGGIAGVYLLKSALEHRPISAMILSRPENLVYDRKEINLLLKNSDGVGLSAISDWVFSELEKISKHVKKEKKFFAIHASERVRENIDDILDLKPNFIIHMVQATESDLIRVKENNIPVVVCLRSNSFFGLKPDFKLLKKVGNEVILGTDNGMINPPNILDEIKHLKSMTRVFSSEEILRMVTVTPRKVLNQSPCILGPNSPTDFVVLDKKSLKMLYVPKKI